jgi:hypothetical protein
MPFEPDIVVTELGHHRVNLVVDVKTTMQDLSETERGLKEYMYLMKCPIGLLVTPDHMWLYQDRYTSLSPESIELVGRFNLTSVWDYPPPKQEVGFESFVQHWLEELPARPVDQLPKDLRNAVRDYILPEVYQGDVRAAHLR